MVLLKESTARVEVVHDSAIKRWLSAAIIPVGKDSSSIRLTGDSIILEPAGKTRTSRYSFSTSSKEVKGKVCVFGAFDERSADEALFFAKTSGAQALLMTRKPQMYLVTIPLVLISRDEYEYIRSFNGSTNVSLVPVFGSEATVDVTLKAQQVSGENPVEWKSKMVIPRGMFKETISNLSSGMMVNTAPYIYHDHKNKIDWKSSGDACFAENICLFNKIHPGEVKQAAQLSMEHGAQALIVHCKEIPSDWSTLALPVMYTSDGEQLARLERLLNQDSANVGLSIVYEKTEHSPVHKESKHQTPSTKHQSRQEAEDPPGLLSKGWNIVAKGGNMVANGARNVGKVFFGYSPKSKEEFDAVVRRSLIWSHDGPRSKSYETAMHILDRIRDEVESSDEKKQELELLIKTICEMTGKPDYVGDVLVLLFCASVESTASNEGIEKSVLNDLCGAMTSIVNGVVIDSKVLDLELKPFEKTLIDLTVVRLTKHVSNCSTNRSGNTTFVLNAIWIRSCVCEALIGQWEDLKRVTSVKLIETHRESILSFMKPISYNTLLLSIAHDLVDIFNCFGESDPIHICPKAIKSPRCR